MANIAKNRLKSTWTPMTNDEANLKFDRWNDAQRKRVLAGLISRCKVKQLEFAGTLVDSCRPVYNKDFTRELPRVLSLYIFSYLDPRSLCRCSQVCWYWKHLAEVDQLWLPKCVRLGWILSFSPSPYEQGVWKRHYIENILTFQHLKPKGKRTEAQKLLDEDFGDKQYRNPRPKSSTAVLPGGKRPPWRAANPAPKDTWRNNILDNDDEVALVTRRRNKGFYSKEADDVTKTAKTKINTGLRSDKPPSRVPKSKSAFEVNDTFRHDNRPDWAKPYEAAAPFVDTATPQQVLSQANQAPPVLHQGAFQPVTPANKSKINTDTTTGSKVQQQKFTEKPWNVPADGYDSQ